MGKGRILVVEDEAIVALDIQSRLARLGYDLAGHAATGAEALVVAAKLTAWATSLKRPHDGCSPGCARRERLFHRARPRQAHPLG